MELPIVLGVLAALAALVSAVSTVYSIGQHNKREVDRKINDLLQAPELLELIQVELPLSEIGFVERLARLSPSGAVLASWHEVEQSLGDLHLRPEEVTCELGPQIAESLARLRELQGLVAKASKDEKLDFPNVERTALLAAKLAYQLRHQTPTVRPVGSTGRVAVRSSGSGGRPAGS